MYLTLPIAGSYVVRLGILNENGKLFRGMRVQISKQTVCVRLYLPMCLCIRTWNIPSLPTYQLREAG